MDKVSRQGKVLSDNIYKQEIHEENRMRFHFISCAFCGFYTLNNKHVAETGHNEKQTVPHA